MRKLRSEPTKSVIRESALDGNARNVRKLLDEALMERSGRSRLAVIERKRAQHLAGRGRDRRRPGGPQSMFQGYRAPLGPSCLGRYVSHYDLFVQTRRHRARTGVGV